VKNKSYKRSFHCKHVGVYVPPSSTIFEQVKKEIQLTEWLHLWPSKITQVQVIEEGICNIRMRFCN
jgi:hypothetical protein